MSQKSPTETKQKNDAPPLTGYLLIPHELLHVLGYRLVGKQCHYRWGQPFVTPLGSPNRQQDLVGMLLPFATFAILFLGFGILSAFAYGWALRGGDYMWFILSTGLALLTGTYAGTALGDLRNAYLLITKKPWPSRTPFDIFFWPVVDWEDIRQKVANGEIDVKQD